MNSLDLPNGFTIGDPLPATTKHLKPGDEFLVVKANKPTVEGKIVRLSHPNVTYQTNYMGYTQQLTNELCDLIGGYLVRDHTIHQIVSKGDCNK